jgi:hypothetical protein
MEATKRSDWSQDDFHAFLTRLDPMPDLAAKAYERLHRKLQMFFESRPGGTPHAPELADDTIDRVICKFREEPDLVPINVQAYVLGFARNVHREDRKNLRPAPLDFDAPDPAGFAKKPRSDARMSCLRHCLTRLSPEEYQAVVAYYSGDKREKIELRSKTAADLQTSRVALSVKVFRIRKRLEVCIGRCVKRGMPVTIARATPPNNDGDSR